MNNFFDPAATLPAGLRTVIVPQRKGKIRESRVPDTRPAEVIQDLPKLDVTRMPKVKDTLP